MDSPISNDVAPATTTFTSAPPTMAARLNSGCFCITLDRERLARALAEVSGDADFAGRHLASREHLFASVPMFLARRDLEAMAETVQAIEAVARLPAYRDAVLPGAPAIARPDPGPRGAFMGYDFHFASDGPHLIEINTNAGGAFLNALLARAQRACCAEIEALMPPAPPDFEAMVRAMFVTEWRRQRGGRPLGTLAIVDDAPEGQYLYPEFLLAQRLLQADWRRVIVADGRALRHQDGRLWLADQPIDLVYNRLVDFALEAPEHEALRTAYLAGDVVVTPNPHTHALFADKHNLTILCDRDRLVGLGLEPARATILASRVPSTIDVTAANADGLWQRRKSYFFKQLRGHGGKAVYRGDKLTKGVWSEIRKGGYIAQELVPPGERMISVGEAVVSRKSDIRLFTYDGDVLLAAARLYSGQTTNFRTPGGGFAPVYFV
jgi:hypothetical protein